ncbi:MAG: DUF5679 domain-containing protein [Anaerolineae bacterium]
MVRFLLGAVVGFILAWRIKEYLSAGPGVSLESWPLEELEVEAYCVRCRARRPMGEPQAVITKDGRPGLKGTCSVCGGGMFRFTKR